MDPQRYQRIREVFHAAADLAGARRRAYLDQTCAGDPGLRREVSRLLESDGVATSAVVPAATRPPSDAPPPDRLGPYLVQRELGRGGMGVVYLGRHVDTEQPVAIKIIHPWLLLSDRAAERVAREARMGRAVDDHHVVRTLDAGQDAGLHFLVMEVVQGRSLRELLGELDRVPEALLREIALQVAAGLSAIHAAGIVHRDLKPENVLITDDHQIRIMDLGVAKLLEASVDLTQQGHFVGSLHYAAPEQCESGEIGPAADLYALGVVLHELATGDNPFAADTPGASIRAHLDRTPPAISDVSPFFAEVVRTLLEKNPGDRIASADELRDLLRAGESSPWWDGRQAAILAARRPSVPVHRGTGLHGRESELRVLEGAWGAARSGHGSVVLLHAEPGLGKSRLIAELLDRAGPDAHVLYGAYHPAAGMDGLRSALLGHFGPARLEERLRPHLPARAGRVGAFVAFLRREASRDELPLDALSPLLAGLLASLAAERPTLWVMEDLQFAPGFGRDAALALARTVTGQRAMLVLTTREPLEPAPTGLTLRLDRLTDDAIGRLVRDDWPDASPTVVDAIAARSGGVPFFALEMIRTVRETGDLAEVPSAIRDLLGARLTRLARPERDLLDAAAVCGHEFDADLVAAVLDRPVVTVLQDLAELERREGLVRAAGRLYRFDHQQIREIVYADLSDRLRVEIHTRLADAGALAGADPGFLAHHHLHGRRPEAARPWLEAALDAAEREHHHEEALDLLDRALAAEGLVEDDAERCRLVLRRQKRLDLLARRDEQEGCVEQALRLATALDDPALLAEALIARGTLELHLSRDEEAVETLREAGACATRARSPRLEAAALSMEGAVLGRMRRVEEARQTHERARRIADEIGDRPLQIRATINLSSTLRYLERYAEARAEMERASTLVEGMDDPKLLANVAGGLGTVNLCEGRHEEARDAYERQIAVAHEAGILRAEMGGTHNLALVLRELGQPARAKENLLRFRDFARERGDRRAEIVASLNLCRIEADLGDLDAAAAHLDATCEEAKSIGATHIAGDLLLCRAILAQLAGHDEEARRRFEEALGLFERVGEKTGLADSLLGLGRHEEADALGREIGRPSIRLRAAALRGDAARAAKILREDGKRIGIPHRLEAAVDLWRTTGGAAHREEARRLLGGLREDAPPERREGLYRGLARYRGIFD